MIGSNRGLKVLALAEPCDMRKSYDSLSAVVRKELGRNPMSGTLYLFCNKRRTRAKVLMFDGTGALHLHEAPRERSVRTALA